MTAALPSRARAKTRAAKDAYGSAAARWRRDDRMSAAGSGTCLPRSILKHKADPPGSAQDGPLCAEQLLEADIAGADFCASSRIGADHANAGTSTGRARKSSGRHLRGSVLRAVLRCKWCYVKPSSNLGRARSSCIAVVCDLRFRRLVGGMIIRYAESSVYGNGGINVSADWFFERYRERGFAFRTSVLTRYALSLHSKPFVILSGVSGTGKTKIAQLFNPLPPVPPALVAPTPTPISQRQRLSFTVTQGMLNGDRGNIANRFRDVIFEPPELQQINIRIPQLIAQGRDDNIIDPINIAVETPTGEVLDFGLYAQRASSPLMRLRTKSKRGEQPTYDSSPYLRQHYHNGDIVELEKVGPYRFRIIRAGAEPQDQLQAHAVADQQEAVGGAVNQLFIPVQSNWTDRTELFGYYNQLEGSYSSTRLIRFIQEAAENPAVPHFLILDEMNLSKVEHYFSDFLSCLESRIRGADAVSQEPIHLHSRGDFAPADDPLVEQVPADLYLPANLYVTGTVNVDETTYMFSPKVLDRAHVIEFNDVDLGLLEDDGQAAADGFILSTIPSFEGAAPVTKQDYLDAPPRVRDLLKELINLLEPHSMHFGYRVAQEICRFVNSARLHVKDDEPTIATALDAAIVQKVLPKFSGSQAQLEEPLKEVLAMLIGGAPGFETLRPDDVTASWLFDNRAPLAGAPYPLSVDKLQRMLNDLYVRGFTNFIG